MGLDLVETVYRIEEEFEITIPDEAAEKMTTPRMVIDYLLSRPEVSEKWSRDYVHLSVWMILEDELSIKREDFNDDSRFIEDMGAD
jgi:acyl carrier protein